jgi:putative copper resistance protein D
MLQALAAARFCHFAAATLLFGLVAFPVYARIPGQAGRMPARIVQGLAILALVTDVAVLLAAAVNMTGFVSTLLDPGTLLDIVQGTGFGQVWGLRVLLGVVIVVLAFRGKGGGKALPVLCLLFLVAIAYTGHSRMEQGALGWADVFAGALHLIAAGAWLGGLLALVLLVPRLIRLGRQAAAADVLHQFSGMGYAAVAVLIATGLFKSVLLVGHLGALVSTAYGQVLTVKLILFAGMGVLALSNRFWITPRLRAHPADAGLWLARLQRQVRVELILGLLVLAVVGLLGALEPPVAL